MLLIHSILQPYDEKNSFANKLDALIFFNLNCINALAVYNYYSVIDIQGASDVAIGFQLMFVYLPLVYVPFRFVWWFRKACCTNEDDARVPILEHDNNRRNYDEQMFLVGQHPDYDPEGQRERLREIFQQHTVNMDSYEVIEDGPL